MSGGDSIRGTVLLIGAGAILVAAVVHLVINVPHLREDMLGMGMRPRLLGAVSLVLYFSVVAMCIFGALVLTAAISTFRGRMPASAPLWLVAAAYLTFGLFAFVKIDANSHFLGYAAMGLVVAMGAGLTPVGGDQRGVFRGRRGGIS
jgi:hypothetical protein